MRMAGYGAIAAFIASGLAAPAQADEFTLAAAAGYRRPITEVATAFEAHSGHKVLQTYGHMGQVIAQARDGRQVTMVCGDAAVLHHAEGLSFAKMVPLGQGRLAIAYRKGLALARAEDLARDDFKRIGIPDQKNAIYGKAARQFLERSQLAGSVDPRLVAVATVPQVTAYLAAGELDAGFINATEALGAGSGLGGFVDVPPALYDPVQISCGLVSSAAPSAAAAAFADFLTTAPAQAILKRHGL